MSIFSPPINLLFGLVGVFSFCLWSWFLVGWATVTGAILTIYSAKYLRDLLTL